jgi:nucleoside-diphosphate-sugar epimerase
VGTTTSCTKASEIRALGAEPVVLDVLDEAAVLRAIWEASPDAIVHEATALAGFTNVRKFDDEFALTNRLRREGTDNLLAAAREAGVKRFVAQSFAGWPFARAGSLLKDESAPLDPDPPKNARRTLAAIEHLERAVTGADRLEGIVVRYGGLYGPGTSLDEGGPQYDAIKKRRVPIVGNGSGMWSFVHVDDAAGATVAAVERGRRGIYNIVDDEPAPASEWLPYLAEALGAKPPRRVPEWLARLVAGEQAVSMMTQARGAANAKAKRELAWKPRYATWREGFLGAPVEKAEFAA